VFRFLRCEGRSEDAARELTQAFFARLLEGGGVEAADPRRGRFRSYLLGALKHYLADQRAYEHREKRGGEQGAESLDAKLAESTDTAAGLQVRDPRSLPSDHFFDRQWALALMNQALEAVEAEFKANNKHRQFLVLRPWLAGESESLSQAEAAQELGVREGAVKVAIHRLRKRFRELVRLALAQTVDSPEAVDEELRYLVEVLAHH
jgi:RNA polymerase sigma-70 factor (ECF subfamily)